MILDLTHIHIYVYIDNKLMMCILVFNGTQCENDLVNDCTASTCGDDGVCQDLVDDTNCVCPFEGGYDER